MSSNICVDSLQCLTEEYVENILRKYFKDPSLQVIQMDTSAATVKGESYCSIMTRVKVSYKARWETNVKVIHFLAKTTYENNPYLTSILQKYDIYNTEMEMYETVFPQLQQLLKDIGDKDKLCADTIYVDHQLNTIIFEDLSLRKFTIANRLEGMDEAHVKMCLKKLAKMHATAAVLNERQGGSLEKFCHGLFNRHVNCYGIFFENIIRVCAKFVETCPELGAYYSNKLLNLIPYTAEYATRCYDLNPKHFLTLIHGDMWTNNVMVQYHNEENRNEQVIRDVLLIDFQYCNWTSPAVDLHYFFNISLQDDLLLYHQPKLVEYYHQELIKTLLKLKYKQHIPTLNEFSVQLKERGFYAVTSLLVNFPLMINDKTDDADLENLLGSDERAQRFHQVLYTNERVQRIIKIMLPRFDKMGFLDIVE